jgi:monoamine oxidase
MGDSQIAVDIQTHFGENNYSGYCLSQASIIQEMYDHNTADYKG